MWFAAAVVCLPFVSQLARLERLVSKQEELLRDYRPQVHVAPLDPELKRKVRKEQGVLMGLGLGLGLGERGERRGAPALFWSAYCTFFHRSCIAVLNIR